MIRTGAKPKNENRESLRMAFRLASILVAVGIVACATARSEQSLVPADIASKLREIGRVVDPPATAPLYAPLQQKEPYQGIKVDRDIKYGPADRNLLDLFTPEAGSSYRSEERRVGKECRSR